MTPKKIQQKTSDKIGIAHPENDASLGIYRTSLSNTSKSADKTKEERNREYAEKMSILNHAKWKIANRILEENHIKSGMRSCGFAIQKNAFEEVLLSPEGKLFFTTKKCKSWMCPLCSWKNSRGEAHQIEQALNLCNKNGWYPFFITFTISHNRKEGAMPVMEDLNEIYRTFIQHRTIRDLKKDYDFIFQIMANDGTATKNGYHAHKHCVFAFKEEISATDLKDIIFTPYKNIAKNRGRKVTWEHGLDVELIDLKDGSSSIAHYQAKMISNYATKDKAEKIGSLAPMDLLVPFDHPDAKIYHRRWLDIYQAMKGKQKIRWTPGFKQQYGIKEYEYDGGESLHIGSANSETIAKMKDPEIKLKIEEMLSKGLVDDVNDFLSTFSSKSCIHFDPKNENLLRLQSYPDFTSKMIVTTGLKEDAELINHLIDEGETIDDIAEEFNENLVTV